MTTSVVTSGNTRFVAHFAPEVWVNDVPVPIDEPVDDWDVTAEVEAGYDSDPKYWAPIIARVFMRGFAVDLADRLANTAPASVQHHIEAHPFTISITKEDT